MSNLRPTTVIAIACCVITSLMAATFIIYSDKDITMLLMFIQSLVGTWITLTKVDRVDRNVNGHLSALTKKIPDAVPDPEVITPPTGNERVVDEPPNMDIPGH